MKNKKQQLIKILKAANRIIALEQPKYSPTVVHKTSKRDKTEKISNTVRNYDLYL